MSILSGEDQLSRSVPLYIDGYDRPGTRVAADYSDFSYLRIKEKDHLICPEIGEDLVPLYKVSRDKREHGIVNDNSVVAYRVSRDLRVRTLWVHPLGPKTKLSRTHLMVTKPNGSDDGLVLVPLLNQDGTISPETVILDVKTGSEVHRIKNNSVVHFSMPLVFDEKLLIPTQSGIEVYSLKSHQ